MEPGCVGQNPLLPAGDWVSGRILIAEQAPCPVHSGPLSPTTQSADLPVCLKVVWPALVALHHGWPSLFRFTDLVISLKRCGSEKDLYHTHSCLHHRFLLPLLLCVPICCE